jgi:hypothetical protein
VSKDKGGGRLALVLPWQYWLEAPGTIQVFKNVLHINRETALVTVEAHKKSSSLVDSKSDNVTNSRIYKVGKM